MRPQEYIQQQLDSLKQAEKQQPSLPLEESIKKLVLSKKFRKYSASPNLINHIEKAIAINTRGEEPINITFLNGAYKLWRLKESPKTDWAELFSLIYYTNWVKEVCAIYKPGVHFDFFMDDLIIPKLNNVDISEAKAYIKSFNSLLEFISKYQPNNLKMTLTPVSSQFESETTFNQLLEKNIEELKTTPSKGLAAPTDAQRSMIELNVKVTEKQKEDPLWREKVWRTHTAYLKTKKEADYHFRPEKILAFTQPLSSGTSLSVGTTKTSVAKFWAGVGALKKKGNSYIETILSPNQLEKFKPTIEPISIPGLGEKNFQEIRVIK